MGGGGWVDGFDVEATPVLLRRVAQKRAALDMVSKVRRFGCELGEALSAPAIKRKEKSLDGKEGNNETISFRERD